MTLSVPSAFAALISAAMPPPLAAEVTLEKSVPLLLEPPDELLPQPAARITLPSATAMAAIFLLFRTISPPHCRPQLGQDASIVAGEHVGPVYKVLRLACQKDKDR